MTDALETGLRHRLRRALRRVESQHRTLRPLLAEAEESLRAGTPAAEIPQLAQLHDALKAHFELEDEVLFPAIHGLSPSTGAAIEALSREHETFLSELRRMLEAPADGDREVFAKLRAALGLHERREEQALETVVGIEDLRAG